MEIDSDVGGGSEGATGGSRLTHQLELTIRLMEKRGGLTAEAIAEALKLEAEDVAAVLEGGAEGSGRDLP